MFVNTKYEIAHKDSPDARGIDCALLYDSERFKPLVITNLAVKIDSVPDFNTRDILYVKGEVYGKKKIHLLINHWPSRREGQKESEHKRIRAAEVARAKVNEILKADPKACILREATLAPRMPTSSCTVNTAYKSYGSVFPFRFFNNSI